MVLYLLESGQIKLKNSPIPIFQLNNFSNFTILYQGTRSNIKCMDFFKLQYILKIIFITADMDFINC